MTEEGSRVSLWEKGGMAKSKAGRAQNLAENINKECNQSVAHNDN
jgi:hypothetical protein